MVISDHGDHETLQIRTLRQKVVRSTGKVISETEIKSNQLVLCLSRLVSVQMKIGKLKKTETELK